jgi:hypothetical protein
MQSPTESPTTQSPGEVADRIPDIVVTDTLAVRISDRAVTDTVADQISPDPGMTGTTIKRLTAQRILVDA